MSIDTLLPKKLDKADDSYKSVIGDELDFFDLLSNKSPDKIIRELKKLDDSVDGIGNLIEEKSRLEVI